MHYIRKDAMASNPTFSRGESKMNQNGLDPDLVSFHFCRKYGTDYIVNIFITL